MIYQPTKLIEQVFVENNLHCQVSERGEMSVVLAGFNGKNARNIMVHFISRSDAHDVAVRVLGITTVAAERRGAMLEVLNGFNKRFRFVKFVLDDSGAVNLDTDVPVRTTNVGEVCMELFVRIMQILDEIYPELMKAAWA